jgi:hypothetical protein
MWGLATGGENVARDSGLRVLSTAAVRVVIGRRTSAMWRRVAERAVVAKIWLGLLVVGVELLMLGWLVGTHTVDWLVPGMRSGQ